MYAPYKTQTHKDIWEAAQLLRKHGNCKFQEYNHKGEICTVEALYRASGSSRYGTATAFVRQKLKTRSLCNWNNTNTPEHIITTLEAIAKEDMSMGYTP